MFRLAPYRPSPSANVDASTKRLSKEEILNAVDHSTREAEQCCRPGSSKDRDRALERTDPVVKELTLALDEFFCHKYYFSLSFFATFFPQRGHGKYSNRHLRTEKCVSLQVVNPQQTLLAGGERVFVEKSNRRIGDPLGAEVGERLFAGVAVSLAQRVDARVSVAQFPPGSACTLAVL